eukprot:m.178024 g.178024  ORF g.178024 m.178024 type:complete len:306 (-) comp9978_c0_seq2:315-1232(-)
MYSKVIKCTNVGSRSSTSSAGARSVKALDAAWLLEPAGSLQGIALRVLPPARPTRRDAWASSWPAQGLWGSSWSLALVQGTRGGRLRVSIVHHDMCYHALDGVRAQRIAADLLVGTLHSCLRRGPHTCTTRGADRAQATAHARDENVHACGRGHRCVGADGAETRRRAHWELQELRNQVAIPICVVCVGRIGLPLADHDCQMLPAALGAISGARRHVLGHPSRQRLQRSAHPAESTKCVGLKVLTQSMRLRSRCNTQKLMCGRISPTALIEMGRHIITVELRTNLAHDGPPHEVMCDPGARMNTG